MMEKRKRQMSSAGAMEIFTNLKESGNRFDILLQC